MNYFIDLTIHVFGCLTDPPVLHPHPSVPSLHTTVLYPIPSAYNLQAWYTGKSQMKITTLKWSEVLDSVMRLIGQHGLVSQKKSVFIRDEMKRTVFFTSILRKYMIPLMKCKRITCTGVFCHLAREPKCQLKCPWKIIIWISYSLSLLLIRFCCKEMSFRFFMMPEIAESKLLLIAMFFQLKNKTHKQKNRIILPCEKDSVLF